MFLREGQGHTSTPEPAGTGLNLPIPASPACRICCFPDRKGMEKVSSALLGQPPAALLPVELWPWLWLGGNGSCDRSLLPSRLCHPTPPHTCKYLTGISFSLFQPEEKIIWLGLTLKRSFLNSERRQRGGIVELWRTSERNHKNC